MLKFLSNHKMLFIFMIFSIFFLPITYKDVGEEGILGYERVFMCVATVLASSSMGYICDIALKKEGV